MVDRQHTAIVRGRHTEPVYPVIACHRLVVAPAFGESACRGILEGHHAALAGRAGQTEIKPLRELGMTVGPHAQTDVASVFAGQHFDRARVEVARNR
jgi:hypothetical protein